MKNSISLKLLAIILIVITGLIYLGVRIANFIANARSSFHENLPTTYSISAADSNLFLKDSWKRLEVKEVINSKVRNQFDFLALDQTYSIIVHRISLSKKILLDSLLVVENRSMNRTPGVICKEFDNEVYSFQYQRGKTVPQSKLWLTISGDSISRTRIDEYSTSLRLICKNLSIRYNNEAPVDIFIDFSGAVVSKAPTEILFQVQHNELILFILISHDTGNVRLLKELENIVVKPYREPGIKM